MSLQSRILAIVALLLVCGSVYAINSQQLLESKVVVQPTDSANIGSSVNVSLLVFNPATSVTGDKERSNFDLYYSMCKQNIQPQCSVNGVPDYNCCMLTKAAEAMGTPGSISSQTAQMGVSYLQNAHFRFEYYNTLNGQYVAIPACNNIVASTQSKTFIPSQMVGQDTQEIDFWSGTCNIPTEIYTAQTHTWIRVWYVPQQGDSVAGKEIGISSYGYMIETAKVSPADQLTLQINNLVQSSAQSSDKIMCFGLFLIMGALLASMYFAGKSPVSLLDITTPRLPSPKGPVASGQIITPFGYGEMKSTINAKMKFVTAGSKLIADRALSNAKSNSDYNELLKAMKNAPMSAADKASGKASAQDSAMHDVLIKAGLLAGKSRAELMDIAKVRPNDLKDQHFKFIREQILNPLQAKGGKEELLARSVDEWLKGKRVLSTLDMLTGHPEIGKPSAMHYRLSNTLNKFVGANRYQMVGGMVMATVDSSFRSARVGGKMAKSIFTEAPHMARGVGKTLLELKGGPNAMEALEAKGKTSAIAAWAYGQLKVHPSEVIVGNMFPVHDKMAHLYKVLRDETVRDEMRYVLRQLYKNGGVRSDISELELGELGYRNIDILKRINYNAAVQAIDHEVERILSDPGRSAYAKLNALKEFAEAQGAHIDHSMVRVSQRIDEIDHMARPDYAKMVLMQELLESENKHRQAIAAGSKNAEEAYICHVGGDTLKGSQIWETLLYRQMVKDKEEGYKGGGIREYAMLATLEAANRTASLAPSTSKDYNGKYVSGLGINQLPEYMRNKAELEAVEKRNTNYFRSLFTNEYANEFQAQHKGKSIQNASIQELVEFSWGAGKIPKTGDIDKKTGTMAWYAYSEAENELPKHASLLDLKRFWTTSLEARENFAIAQWTQSRIERSHIGFYKASIEAEADRLSAAGNWSIERRATEIKKLHIADQLRTDMEARFNSIYGQNAYGTTKETTRFYSSVLAGFMEQAMKTKGIDSNHPDMRFIDQIDTTNPKQLARLSLLLNEHREAFEEAIHKPVTYDDIAKSKKAMVMFYEGGFAYYKKGLMLSDADRIMGGQVALRDNKGQLRAYAPEDVTVKFANREDLSAEYARLSQERNPKEWDSLINRVKSWAKEGGYNYDREKVVGAVLWHYGQTTYDYSRFTNESAISIESKRQVTPLAPSTLRYFGVEAPALTSIIKPFRDIALTVGDYISKVSLLSGGHLLRASYDITPLSEIYRQRSRELSADIYSGKYTKYLTKEEQGAYRQLAVEHSRFHQVWDYAIDRHPAKASTSYGSAGTFAAGFNMGPSTTYSVKDNLRSYLRGGEYTNFMAIYGFPMDVAGKMLMPYQSMIRGMQMAMQGYPGKWDTTGDPMRMWDHTQPRFGEWMQSFNPFSFSWFGGKNSDRMRKLNVWGGSMERSQLAGADFLKGLAQSPQDLMHSRKGIFSNLRTLDANPGASFYNYRNTLSIDSPMAEYLYRMKEGAFFHDEGVRKAAMDNTTRRTIAAEALAMKREGELRNFGMLANPIYGWANPFAFLFHMPMPFVPQSLTPKDMISKWVMRSKGGHTGTFTDSMRSFAERSTTGISRFFQPGLRDKLVACPKCGMTNQRGVRCKNPTCGCRMYGS